MLTEIIREAWIALKRNTTRSALTMLGIVWGIATVTLLIAYGSSFRQILVGGFDAFGKSVVICWPQQTSEQPGGQRAGKKVVLEQADLDAVKEMAPLVLPHRLIVRTNSRLRGRTVQTVVADILDTVELDLGGPGWTTGRPASA